MRRLRLLLLNELKLIRTTIPFHAVGIFQPTLMFTLMSFILVMPTFDMRVVQPATPLEHELVAAMNEVGSPIGEKYIEPILVETDSPGELAVGQVISVETVAGESTAVQRFGLIDSNIVKNFRNRLTAAALSLWNESLDGYAVTIEQRPWLPRDIPYGVFFGMAMLPLAAFLGASLAGGALMAQEFEFDTITEFRLSPIPMCFVVGTRLLRLSLTGLLSAVVLMVAIGLLGGVWPSSLLGALAILLGMALLGACLGMIAGLLLQSTLPSFLMSLVTTFFTWIMGSAFGLAAGFGGVYEAVSRWMPNTHAVELLFPLYYRVGIGASQPAILFLSTACFLMVILTAVIYRQKVLMRKR
jgi:ABC-type multidrug transport system permease subunit